MFFCVSVYVLRSVLLPFVAGIIIGYLLDPLTSKFEKWGMNRTLATILVMTLVVLILFPLLVLLIGVIDEQLGQFIASVPAYLSAFLKKAEPFFAELHPLRSAIDRRLGRPLPHQLANGTRTHLYAIACKQRPPFLIKFIMSVFGISSRFQLLSPS